MHGKQHLMYCHPFFTHGHTWRRRFLTEEERQELTERSKERKIKRIELYKESLENELKGVNEALAKLKQE